VCAGAGDVELRWEDIQWVADDEDGFLTVEYGVAHRYRVVILGDQDPLIVHSFTSESTVLECLVHRVVHEDCRPSVDASDLVDVRADHGVASTWEGGQGNAVLEETFAIEEGFLLWNLINSDAFLEHVRGVLSKVPLLEALERIHRL